MQGEPEEELDLWRDRSFPDVLSAEQLLVFPSPSWTVTEAQNIAVTSLSGLDGSAAQVLVENAATTPISDEARSQESLDR